MARAGRRAGVLWALACVALASSAPTAGAQALPPIDYSQFDVLISTLGNASLPPGGHDRKPGGKTHRRPAAKPPTARQRAALRFTAVPQVTQRLYRRAIEQPGAGVDPAVLTAQLEAAKAQFRKVLTGTVGWSARDVGDVAAFSLVQGYAVVHQDATLPARGLAALRREVRDNLARQPRVRRLSDARQQEIAETFELRVIFFLDAVNDATAAGDPAASAAVRADVRAWAKRVFGVDVAELRLTSRGFVER